MLVERKVDFRRSDLQFVAFVGNAECRSTGLISILVGRNLRQDELVVSDDVSGRNTAFGTGGGYFEVYQIVGSGLELESRQGNGDFL